MHSSRLPRLPNSESGRTETFGGGEVSGLYEWERHFNERDTTALSGANRAIRELIYDFASRKTLIPKKNFQAMLERLLRSWKLGVQSQSGYLACSIQELDDGLLDHLTSIETLLYQRLQKVNKCLNNFLSIYRASDEEREFESINGILDTALQFRTLQFELQEVWSKLLMVYIPRIEYAFSAISG